MKSTSIKPQKAFTLLELILSLALIVVVTSLIGSLISMYVRSFSNRVDNIKQKQLARSLLTMMADDIRAVVTAQQYDKSCLEQMLGGGSSSSSTAGTGSGAGTGATGTGSTGGTGGTGTGSGTGAGTGSGSSSNAASSSQTSGSSSGTTTTTTTTTVLPPGIYGSQYQLMVDVSRIPRTHEFNVQSGMVGSMVDVPGDVKTVTYMMQSASPLGVQDSLRQVATSVDASLATNSGLIRQAIDRNIYSYAQSSGTMTSMNSGDMIASEVVALEFSYYDGMQWLTQWDSSQQGLPWLIQITLALQDPVAAEKNSLDGGINLRTTSAAELESSGVKVFQLAVAIPGAALQAASSATGSTGSGMEAMGLE